MALASGLIARSDVASDSGASVTFVLAARMSVRLLTTLFFLPRWSARLPSLDDARVVVGLCDRPGVLPYIDSNSDSCVRKRIFPSRSSILFRSHSSDVSRRIPCNCTTKVQWIPLKQRPMLHTTFHLICWSDL